MTAHDKKRETLRSLEHVEKVLAFLQNDLAENQNDHGTLLPDSIKTTLAHLNFTRVYINHIRKCVETYAGDKH